MTLPITKLSSNKRSGRLILLQGRSGTGKTYQGGLLMQAGMRVLWASVERKLATIQHLEPEVWPIMGVDFPLDAQEKHAMLNTPVPPEGHCASDVIKLLDYLRNEDHPYDVVYFDSGMRYTWRLLEHLISTTTTTQGDKDPRRAFLHYGKKVKMLLDKLTDLTDASTAKHPMHVVFTWGISPDKDESGRQLWLPVVDGNMVGPTIPYNFDDVLTLKALADYTTGEYKYVMETRATHDHDGKVSSPVNLPPVIESPNLASVIKTLSGTHVGS